MFKDPGNKEYEIKYTFNNTYSGQLIEFLDAHCTPDPEHPFGVISSIYYDTVHWTFLGEKLNSDYLKTKVRLRWYTNSHCKRSEYSFAEAKCKIGNRRNKIRVQTPYSGNWLANVQLSSSELLEIPFLLIQHGLNLKHVIYPAFEIRYTRQRYIDPYSNARICIDYDISSPRANHQMLPLISSFDLQTAVFELKGGLPELPVNLYPVIDLGCKKSCFSKYYSCYRKIVTTRG